MNTEGQNVFLPQLIFFKHKLLPLNDANIYIENGSKIKFSPIT